MISPLDHKKKDYTTLKDYMTGEVRSYGAIPWVVSRDCFMF